MLSAEMTTTATLRALKRTTTALATAWFTVLGTASVKVAPPRSGASTVGAQRAQPSGMVGFVIADARGTDHDYPSDHELAAAQDAVLKAQRQYDKLFQDASFDLEKTSS
jgi:hypothetical protein